MKLLTISILILITTLGFANDKKDKSESETAIKLMAAKNKKGRFLTPNAAITMADGTQKTIANVKLGDQVITYSHGKSVFTEVNEIAIYDNPSSLLTTVYLRPANDNHVTVPAIILEATPHHKVQTISGKKRMKKLTKKDVLYHYDHETGHLTTWKVGAVKTNSKRVSKAYDLKTNDGTFIVDNLMVANH